MAGGIYNPFGFGGGEVPQPVPRRMPQDIPAAPFGFAPPPSKMQKIGAILNEYNPIDAFWRLYDSPMARGGDITDQNIADGLTVTGTAMGGGAMIPAEANSLRMGIKAYHGSPHSFDQFSMDKIGTGEGAQAYGHGLYFAEKEGVAKSYRDTLSGKQYKFNADPKDIAAKYGDGAIDTFYKYEGDPKEIGGVISGLRQAVQKNLAEFGVSDVSQLKPMYDGDLASATIKMARNADNMEQLIKSGDIALDPGHMYEVNIDADPNAFLDWDKPLNEQPEAVRKSFGDLVGRDLSKETGWAKMNGQQALDAIMERYGSLDWPDDANAALRAQYRDNSRSKASAILAGKGIPGIKYLDAGSRVPSAMAKKELSEWQTQLPLAEKELADATARGDKWLISRKQAEVQRVKDGIARVSKEADGTHNYVVFDDKLISIVKKYGIAGASAMLGYNLLEGINPAQADELKRIEAGK